MEWILEGAEDIELNRQSQIFCDQVHIATAELFVPTEMDRVAHSDADCTRGRGGG